MRNVVYRVDGGPKEGYGHIIRAINIQNAFKKNNLNFTFIIKKERKGFYYLKKKIKKKIIYLKNTNNYEFETMFKLKPKLVIFDTLNTSKKIFKELSKEKIKFIVFEDYKNKALSYSNLIFNCNLDGPKSRKLKIKNGIKYFGYPFKIFKPNIKNYFKKSPKNDLTICLGGGEVYKGEIKKIITNLWSILKDYKLNINLVLGHGVNRNTIKNLINKKYKMRIFHNLQNIFPLLNKSKYLITGGGSTVYEGVYFNCINFCYGRNTHQKNNIKKFKDAKFCIEIRSLNKLYLKKFFKKNLLINKPLISNKIQKKIFKNQGLLLVKQKILKLLNENTKII